MISTRDKSAIISGAGRREGDCVKQQIQMPKFKNESEEADWWASRDGRTFVKLRSAEAKSKAMRAVGSRLIAQIAKKSSIQIAIRLPEADLERARKIATRKGIGYQTLIKMLVHEGLQREAKGA